jgi:hypothetical protein
LEYLNSPMSFAFRQRDRSAAIQLASGWSMNTALGQHPAALDCLRITDRSEGACASLYDSFSSLPNVSLRHGTLDQALEEEGVDCLVLPIYDRRTENNRTVTSLLRPVSALNPTTTGGAGKLTSLFTSPGNEPAATTPITPPNPQAIDSETVFSLINDLYAFKGFGDGILPLFQTYWLSTPTAPTPSTSSTPGTGSSSSSTAASKLLGGGTLTRGAIHFLSDLGAGFGLSTSNFYSTKSNPNILILAVTIWQLAPAVTPETHIAQAFRAVLAKVHEHNQQVLERDYSVDTSGQKPKFIRNLLSPLFITPCVLFSSEVGSTLFLLSSSAFLFLVFHLHLALAFVHLSFFSSLVGRSRIHGFGVSSLLESDACTFYNSHYLGFYNYSPWASSF